MRKLLLVLIITLFSISLFSTAEAKRFGGGRSFGMSRSASSFSQPINNSRFQSAAPTQNKWLAPLAGLAMGGALASLFMGHGVGSSILTLLMVAGLIMVGLRFLQNRMQGATQKLQSYTMAQPQQNYSSMQNVYPLHKTSFDETSFLRQAKATFIRLQAAYDNKNLADIREFTTPEVFAEIQLQLHERGDESNQTDVLRVDAEFLEENQEGAATFATVRFTAQIREKQEAAFETVKEIWHFRQDAGKSNWVVAGIQQD